MTEMLAASPAAGAPRAPASTPWARLAGPLVGLAVMPLVYGLAAFHGHWGQMMKPPILQHMAFEWAANAVVVAACLGLAGRFDQRLGQVFARTLLVHGCLAFLTLVTRHYYSIPMMLVGVVASAGLGAATTAATTGARRLRAGVLGPWPAEETGLDLAPIDTPGASIQGCDLILVTFAGETPAAWAATLTRALLAGRPVRHLAEVLEEARGAVDVDGFELDHLRPPVPRLYDAGKRLLDVVVALALTPLALMVTAGAALAVRIAMGAPVLFVQTRLGRGRAPFRMVKLRTMRVGCAAGSATGPDDARITPLGRWLRRFHIDELPQLWNVLTGDMSLVGPRPEQPALADAYARQSPAFAFRDRVRPGVTGWAQVRAPYAADLAETRVKLAYDLFYLKNLSFALDVQILARTVWTVLSGAGAR